MKRLTARTEELSSKIPEVVPEKFEVQAKPADGRFAGRSVRLIGRFVEWQNKVEAVDSDGKRIDLVFMEKPVGRFRVCIAEHRQLREKTPASGGMNTSTSGEKHCNMCKPPGSKDESERYVNGRNRIEIPELRMAWTHQIGMLRVDGASGLCLPFVDGEYPCREQQLMECDLNALIEIAFKNPPLSLSFNFGKEAGATNKHIHVKAEVMPYPMAIEQAMKATASGEFADYMAPVLVFDSQKDRDALWRLVDHLQKAKQAYNLFLRGSTAGVVGRKNLESKEWPGLRCASLEIGGFVIVEDRALLMEGEKFIWDYGTSSEQVKAFEAKVKSVVEDVCMREEQLLEYCQ